MMVSEPSRSLQSQASSTGVSVATTPTSSTAANTTTSAGMDAAMGMSMGMNGAAIAFPASLANATAVATSMGDVMMSDASSFSSLPFEEQLMSMPADLAQQADPAAAAAAAAAIGASFFIDTAAIAQQIAMTVSDEKKLSDNILDLIPPPQPIVSTIASDASTSVVSTTTTTTTTAGSLTMPLGPPPGLMDMRALSPPMSLLPDFSSAMPTMTLNAAAAALSSSQATTTTTTTTVAPPAPATIAAPTTTAASTATAAAVAAAAAAATLSAAPTAEERRKASVYAAASLLKKRKSAEAFASDAAIVAASTALPTSSYITPSSAVASSQSSMTPPTTTPTSASATPSVSAATAATLQNLAREKVMKEPQSGDLYECVITKRNGGLGLTLACVDDHVQITGLAPDTPAANSGICVGDTLVAVSGLPVRGLQFSTVIGRLKSSSRNSVVLKLRRNPFRHNANGNGLPYRANNGIGAGLKRPARPLTKTAENNSANVLSNSKSMALETRLAGPSAVTSTTSATSDSHTATATSNSAFHIKTEPVANAYFPTDACVLTSMGASATTAMPAWRVAEEDRDRYYAESRRLRQELAHAVTWRRRERNTNDALHEQFQEIAHKFESEMQMIFQIGAATSSAAAAAAAAANGGATASAVDSSSVAKSHHEDLVALRQKLLEVNHALARQQTEILELKERDARHAFHEMRRIKAETVREIQKRMQELVMTSATQLKSPGEPLTKSCEERIEGVRPSVFEHLFQQQSTASVASKLLASRHHHHHHHHRSTSLVSSGSSGLMGIKEEKTASIDLDLDMAQASQVLTWNLREHLPARSLLVQVVGGLKVEYVTHEEALTLRYTLQLVEEKP